MSDYLDDDQFDNFEDEDAQSRQKSGGPADLRRALKEAQRELKELREFRATAEKAERERSVKQILQDNGADARLATLIPADVTDEAGVTKWLGEYKDLFNLAPKQNDPTPEAETEGSDDGGESETASPASEGLQALLAQMQQMQASERAGETVVPPAKQAETLEKLRSAGSFDNAASIITGG